MRAMSFSSRLIDRRTVRNLPSPPVRGYGFIKLTDN